MLESDKTYIILEMNVVVERAIDAIDVNGDGGELLNGLDINDNKSDRLNTSSGNRCKLFQ